ncbi:oxidoreductase [Lentilactobacillus curieae]|uniref:Oxidoreductase n=1 Tax=Lentilactobacillus curieae TaxID=1138822 RepID=A0A1S6QG62_9LACO|nr:NAD(P)-dependent oxidoreductase [Lentilactobacillus curieae]AQW20604.1 oxidoreductase [Lentilactobacillus curieae]
MKIGFIGTGIMGTGMIKNLLAAGYQVDVYNRTKDHAQAAINNGAQWQDNVASLTRSVDVIISIVGFPADVEEVYLGKDGVLANAHEGQTIIDMTTSSPMLAEKIYSAANKIGVAALDAPVSGGDVGAKSGTLTIMVGGKQSAFEQQLPIFKAMGSAVTYFGGTGEGQHAKMANQIMVAGTMTGMIESLVYADKAGLNLDAVIKMIGGGAAQNWSMDNYGPRILQGDLQPGFMAKHFLKDLRIVLSVADEMKISLPGTAVAKKLYEKMVSIDDWGELGTQGLIKLWTEK